MRAKMARGAACALLSLLVVLCLARAHATAAAPGWLEQNLDADAAMAALERDTDGPFMQQRQPQHPQREFDEGFGAMPSLLETQATARASASTRAGWVNGPPRSRRARGRRSSISAERAALARKAREDAQYAENLRKFAARREKFRVANPAAIPAIISRTAARMVQNGPHDAHGPLTNEAAQVQSLLQMSEFHPQMPRRDPRAPLTRDLLLGRGLHTEAGRRAFLASPKSHPKPPAFRPLPQAAASSGKQQSRPISLIQKSASMRPAAAGPPTAALPPPDPKPAVAAPKPSPAATAAAVAVPAEHDFVAGLPPAFMELDAATQVHILALADEELTAEAAAAAQAKAEAAAKAEAEAKAAKEKQAAQEKELAQASLALRTLTELQASTHVPLKKLLHLLAQGKQ